MAQTVPSRSIDYKTLIEAVFRPNPQFPCTELYTGGSTRVYKVSTPEPLVVRIAPGDKDYYEFQAELLDAIAYGDDMTARVLHWEMREIDDQTCGIQVQTYLPGTPLDHYPDPVESRAIVEATYALHQRLYALSNRFRSRGIPTLDGVCTNLLATVDDCPMQDTGRRLLADNRFRELVAQEHYLIHSDLWYQNLLFEHTADGMQVRIVDVDPVIFGPKVLQAAVLFSSCFLVSSVLSASNSPHALDLDSLIEYWPESLSRQDVLLMMQVFPVMLGLHKAQQFARSADIAPETYQSSMELLTKCLEVIWEQGA